MARIALLPLVLGAAIVISALRVRPVAPKLPKTIKNEVGGLLMSFQELEVSPGLWVNSFRLLRELEQSLDQLPETNYDEAFMFLFQFKKLKKDLKEVIGSQLYQEFANGTESFELWMYSLSLEQKEKKRTELHEIKDLVTEKLVDFLSVRIKEKVAELDARLTGIASFNWIFPVSGNQAHKDRIKILRNDLSEFTRDLDQKVDGGELKRFGEFKKRLHWTVRRVQRVRVTVADSF